MKPLVQQAKAILLEPKHLEPRRPLVCEHEECAASRRIGAHSLARCLRQAIEAVAQVDRSGADEDPNTAWDHRRSRTVNRRSRACSSNTAGIWRRRDALSSSTNDDVVITEPCTSTSEDGFKPALRLDLSLDPAVPRVSCSMRYFQNFSVAGLVPSSAANASALSPLLRQRSIRFRHSSRPV